MAIAPLKKLLLISNLLISFIANCQIANYVKNGGFEKYITCSTNSSITSYVVNAPGWDEIDWRWGTLLANYCWNRVPENSFFYNYPRNDSAYVLMDVFCLGCPNYGRRTYIRNHLKSNLQAGKTYCVKYFVNL